MFEKKKLDRINELAKKNKEEGLCDEELAERESLRKEYLAHLRSHVKSKLDNIKIMSPEEYEEYVKKETKNK